MNDTHVIMLNDGFLRLVDSMGDDRSIVQAARVSFGIGTKTEEEDRKLINYLMKNGHTSPFEMVTLKWHVKCPVFVARQWQRHRTWSYNEVSQRYTEIDKDYYIPTEEDINFQSASNKQGRGEALSPDEANFVRGLIIGAQMRSYEVYHEILARGVAKELARVVLPMGTYTQFYGQVNLHNLFHFIKLRSDPHAQKEIRVYSDAMLGILENIVPWSVAAFRKYQLGEENGS